MTNLATMTNITQILASLIDSFVLGYSFITTLLHERLRIDITLVMSAFLLVFGGVLVSKRVYHVFEGYHQLQRRALKSGCEMARPAARVDWFPQINLK